IDYEQEHNTSSGLTSVYGYSELLETSSNFSQQKKCEAIIQLQVGDDRNVEQ
ncbi:hypothetical protein DPMN_163284, partial [Dreissena polymorpha]